jgi:hypothetical protein
MPESFIWGPVSGMTTKNTTMIHIRYFSLCIFSSQSKSRFRGIQYPTSILFAGEFNTQELAYARELQGVTDLFEYLYVGY